MTTVITMGTTPTRAASRCVTALSRNTFGRGGTLGS